MIVWRSCCGVENDGRLIICKKNHFSKTKNKKVLLKQSLLLFSGGTMRGARARPCLGCYKLTHDLEN